MSPAIRHRSRRQRPALILLALLLVAVNLRLAITSAASLLALLEASGALSPATIILVPAIPTAVFAIAGVGTGRLALRVGIERTVAVGMLVLAAGLSVRVIPEPWAVLLGTVVATSGLAVVNILLPAVVRGHFGRRIGPVTTAYTTAMALGSATAATVAVPIATWLGSPSLGLAFWALPALLGFFGWAILVPMKSSYQQVQVITTTGSIAVDGRSRGYPRGTRLLTGYFALQSLLSYVLMGWLPTIAADAGISVDRAGLLLGISMVVGVPSTALVISLTRGMRRMRAAFALIAAASVTGSIGMLVAPQQFPELWAVFLGLGMSGFPIALAYVAGSGRSANDSARVSTFVQSVGYSVATAGPLIAGALAQVTGAWTLVLLLLIAGSIVQGIIGLLITRAVGLPSGRQLPPRGSPLGRDP